MPVNIADFFFCYIVWSFPKVQKPNLCYKWIDWFIDRKMVSKTKKKRFSQSSIVQVLNPWAHFVTIALVQHMSDPLRLNVPAAGGPRLWQVLFRLDAAKVRTQPHCLGFTTAWEKRLLRTHSPPPLEPLMRAPAGRHRWCLGHSRAAHARGWKGDGSRLIAWELSRWEKARSLQMNGALSAVLRIFVRTQTRCRDLL